MTTPPFVTSQEAEDAISRIISRHHHIDDNRRSGLGTRPRDVLDHLLREQHTIGVPRWVRAADVQDSLILSNWMWWDDRRRERTLLRRGLRLGLTLAELGNPLGISTPQGLRDRLDRLDALVAHHNPDEKLSRETRRVSNANDPRQRWIDTNEPRVRETLTALLAQLERVEELDLVGGSSHITTGSRDSHDSGHPAPVRNDLDDDDDPEEWIDELRVEAASETLTPATLSLIGLALPAIQQSASKAALSTSHGLNRAIRQAHRLRADYTRGTTEPRSK